MRLKQLLALLLTGALLLALAGAAWAEEETAGDQAQSGEIGCETSGSGGEEEAEDAAEDIPLASEVPVDYDPTAGLTADPVPETTAEAVFLMEAATGTVLWQSNADQQLEPASVTKIMTMLLVCEAIDEGSLTTDTVVTCSAHAAGMGGSQVYLEEGEQMTVDDLLKAVAVASGNDAAVALGEAVSGSEAAFVEKMNRRAGELGMTGTHFVNCTGLPADGHVTTAHDIALMSQALLRHEEILAYTGIWMDSLRGGEFGLSSTNKLIKTYDGITGLKTGYTDTAGFCISATAQRNGMSLIAVVLGADSSANRFETAATLLDYGFANFCLAAVTPSEPLPQLKVTLGETDTVALQDVAGVLLVRSADASSLTTEALLPEGVAAPVESGAEAGVLLVKVGDQIAGALPLTCAASVNRLNLPDVFCRFLQILVSGQG